MNIPDCREEPGPLDLDTVSATEHAAFVAAAQKYILMGAGFWLGVAISVWTGVL